MKPPSLLKTSPYQEGLHFLETDRWEEAQNIFFSLLHKDPHDGYVHSLMAITACHLKNYSKALDHIQKAMSYRPHDSHVYYNAGLIFAHCRDYKKSLEAYNHSIQLDSSFADAFNNAGFLLWSLGEFELSFKYLTRAIGLNPNHDRAHYSRAEILLLWGDLELGFKEYEWRWNHELMPPRSFTMPLWKGEPLHNKTIFIYEVDNFGHGDQLQFCRYALLLKEKGAQVIVECSPEIKPLFDELSFIDQAIARPCSSLPFHDYRIPFLSLPCIFKTNLQNIPFSEGYLKPFLKRKDIFSTNPSPFSLAPHSSLNVGIVWAGNPGHLNDTIRSAPFKVFKPLFEIKSIQFYSFQHGEAARRDLSHEENENLIDLSPFLKDFLQTATFIEQMDLVITVDTAMAHLCGALGKKCWILIPHVPEWRWLLDRPDSPWYQSVRLFRQKSFNEWESLLFQVKETLLKETF